jgi:hypothetical protein
MVSFPQVATNGLALFNVLCHMYAICLIHERSGIC